MKLSTLQKRLGCGQCKFADLDAFNHDQKIAEVEKQQGCCKAPVSFGDIVIERYRNELGHKVYACRKYEFDESRANAQA